ncbi:MAG: endolytic transglycosylase MltG [Deltaproteobacteria bacterium]|nr:endolytic transglycosylase MltG [Deltaproteobacteria bacterium]
MLPRLVRISFLLLLLLLASLTLAWQRVALLLSPLSTESKQQIITIPLGASLMEIGRILEEKKIIRSATVFRYLVKYNGVGKELRAGEHLLSAGMSAKEVVDSLVKGQMKMYRLTVPEGMTMAEMARLIEAKKLAKADRMTALFQDEAFIRALGITAGTLEGCLFPETYYFVANTRAEDIAKAMVRRFFKVWAPYEKLAGESGMTRHEIVTLASIVEKETGARSERPLIAAVFLNRLKRKMPLQSDPTVIYGLQDFDGNLTRSHLETYTPYNTYQFTGLPPGPIANPGEASLKAVLEPAEVKYLYFVSKNDGTHHFSRSLTEHNRAVNRYQKHSFRR